LIEELKSQVYLTDMTKPQRHIAKWVLGNIDDDGYLRRTTEQLVDDLMFQEQLSVTDEEMEAIVKQIKNFDPPGIASANLQECLLKQLEVKTPQTESVQLAHTILKDFFEPFSKHWYDKIKQRLGCSDEAFQNAVQEIVHLNQKPANAFTGNVYETQRETIIPDFSIEERDEELFVVLNTGDIPELHVSKEYSDMLNEYSAMPQNAETRKATQFIKQKMDAARWFIDAIQQRNDTLMRTMTAILKFQYDFFLDGEETSLKPMVLQDIADRTGYDVSTISRVSNSKYVQTRFGTYPLKYFFSESMTNAEGDEVSTREIKKIMLELIAAEDKRNPLNDDQLAELMGEHGYPIARRTIAKYREQLGIQVARLRKRHI
jgi:RNA polymerase sigma-54 factor